MIDEDDLKGRLKKLEARYHHLNTTTQSKATPNDHPTTPIQEEE